MGKSSAAAPAIAMVRRMVMVPLEMEVKSGSLAAAKLAAKLKAMHAARIRLLFAGGIIMARNMPYKATLSALTIRTGRTLPATMPQ